MSPAPRRRGLLAAVSALAVAPGAAPPHPDACLLSLGAALEETWALERAAWAASDAEPDAGPLFAAATELQDRTSAIVGEIEAARALTVAGLLVKLRAVEWCRCGDPLTADSLGYGTGHPATDMRLVAAVLDDLGKMKVS